MKKTLLVYAGLLLAGGIYAQVKQTSGNPLFPGWYADPEGAVFDKQYWIYPTFSAPYNKQVFLDAFSSPDLIAWTKHPAIVDTAAVKWAKRAMWAPAIVKKENKYFLFFGANDIQSDAESGGIGVAVADKPGGPYKDYLGKPLVDKFHNGAQPIDQFVFHDSGGQYYLIYGGWRHCNIAKLNRDFTGFIPFDDGTVFKEITPDKYVEGPYMFQRNGKYYFMWSEGGWTGPDYCVAYAVADSPFGPFKRIGKILQQDTAIANGAGHHSIIKVPGKDEWYIVYHRRPLAEKDGNSRETCIEHMYFDKDGLIKPVVITKEGVKRNPLSVKANGTWLSFVSPEPLWGSQQMQVEQRSKQVILFIADKFLPAMKKLTGNTIVFTMKQSCLFLLVNLFLFHSANAQTKQADTITLANVLKSLYDVAELPQYMDKTYSAQVSSYDITGGNDDGFSGKNSFIRRNADSSLVIFDVKGTGVINRIWTPTPTEDTLDFYADGEQQPRLSIKYSDLFSGKVYPFVAPLCGNDLGGFYCYFPIVFNNGCMIVSRGKKMQFHQVGYRLYPKNFIANTFSTHLTMREMEAVKTISRVWEMNRKETNDLPAIKSVTKQWELLPGKSTTIYNAVKAGRITGIEIDAATAFEGLEKLVDIEITWDDDKTPAVLCPLADFFGYAFGKPAMESLLLGTRNNINYCYIPMPFDKKATIRLRYRNATANKAPAIPVKATVYFSDTKRDAVKEGRLYTSWNRIAANGQPHVILNTAGRGHFIGTVLQAQGLNPGMTYFFEGDDSTVVDGELRFHGTGSEDYFNGGWYALTDRWDGKLSLPLHGCLAYSLPYSHTGAYRFYMSDKISFEKNIFHSIEHGPSGNHVPVDYTSLAFYYTDAAPATNTIPTNALTKVYVPDTLIMYPQLMNATVENNIAVKTAWKYGTGGLSYTYTATDESGLKIDINEIPFGKFKLLLDFVRNPEGCEFSIWMGQHNISGWLSSNAPKEAIEKSFFIADFEHTASRNSISIHFKTLPGKEKFILNRLIFIAKK